MKVFISYRRKNQDFADRLEEQIKRMLKAEIFIDRISNLTSDDFVNDLMNHIRTSDAILLIVSPDTFDKARIHEDNDWIRKEVSLALELSKPIVLVCMEGHYPPSEDELPPDIKNITRKQGIPFYRDYWQFATLNLARFISSVTKIKLSFGYYFVAYKAFLEISFLIIAAILSPIVGGWLWNILNSLLGWSFYLGGSGNEPHGFQAMVWGVISGFPIILLALFATYKYYSLNAVFVQKLGSLFILYTLLSGFGAIAFYDSGIRSFVEARNLGYGVQELIIVVAWAFLISIFVSAPFLLIKGFLQKVLAVKYLLLQIPFAAILSFLAVFASLFVPLPAEQVSPLRGFFAAVGLRLGLFMGIVLAIHLSPHEPKFAVDQNRYKTDL